MAYFVVLKRAWIVVVVVLVVVVLLSEVVVVLVSVVIIVLVAHVWNGGCTAVTLGSQEKIHSQDMA